MRKLTSLLVLLCMFVGTVWGQLVKTSTASDPKYYVLGSYDRGGYLTNVGVDKGLEHVDLADGSYWYFEKANEDGGVYIVNKLMDGEDMIYAGHNRKSTKTREVWYILENGVNKKGVSISTTKSISSSSCIDANNHNTGVGSWAPTGSDWQGTTWSLFDVDKKYNPTPVLGKSRGDRKVTSVSLTGSYGTSTAELAHDYAGENGAAYMDMTDVIFMATPEEEIEASLVRNGNWTHAYVYIDNNNDGFTATINTDDGFTPEEDLVSYSFYSGDEANGEIGKNSAGTELTEGDRNTISLPKFKAPSVEGTYRMRFKLDWNSINPNGGNTNFTTDGGQIVDVTLKVTASVEEVDVVYNFTYDGEVRYTQTTSAFVGQPYPAITAVFPYGVSAVVPTGNITSSDIVDGVVTKTLEMTVNMPFVASANVTNITQWYYTKMHNTAQHTKYIKYVADSPIAWTDTNMDIANIDCYTWAFVGNPFEGYKIVNKAAGVGYAMKSEGSGDVTMTAFESATSFECTASDANVNGFCFKHSNGQYINAQGTAVKHWSDNDAGSTFLIHKTLPIQLTTDDENPVYYSIKSGRGDEYWYTLTDDSKIKLQSYTADDKQLWYFKGVSESGQLLVQLYAKGQSGSPMSYENTGNAADKIVAKEVGTDGWFNTWKFVESTGGAPYALLTPDGSTYLSNNGGVGNNMGMWNSGPESDGGTAMHIYPVVDYSFTDMWNNVYSERTLTTLANPQDVVITGADGFTLSNKVWNGQTLTANVTFPFNVSSNTVTNAVMISSFSGSNFKWYANGTGVNAQMNVLPTSANVVNYLWAIYPSFKGGSCSFTIKNIGTGKYINSTSANNSHNAGVVILADEGSALTYESGAQFKLSTGKYLSLNSSRETNVQIIGTWGSHLGTKNSFPASVVSVTIGEAGYSTVYLPFAVTLPDGVEAYAVESVGASYASLSEVKTSIPANTGAILKATASTYTLNAGNNAEDWSDNMLEGSSVDTYVAGPAYVLAKVDGNVGMYKALLNKNEAGESGSTHFLNNAGKAYLPATAGGSARFLVFDFGTETGIDQLEGENGNVKTEVYDLSGRRVQSAQKGIFIVNGKKVIR